MRFISATETSRGRYGGWWPLQPLTGPRKYVQSLILRSPCFPVYWRKYFCRAMLWWKGVVWKYTGFQEEAADLLANSRLRSTVDSYLYILVSATLQHPRAEFTDDCGEEQAFDLKIHAESIDGDHVKQGDSCVVVFPSFPPEKRFIIPVVQTWGKKVVFRPFHL